MSSPQTLTDVNRRNVAAWAADCAERVLPIFEAEAPHDSSARAAINRARDFARGDLSAADAIRRRFAGDTAANGGRTPAATAAAKSAGQAAAVPHMGAHALGAAAYAVRARTLASPDDPEAAAREMRWQLRHMSPEARAALLLLPPLGENRAGPLGPGLLASGDLGSTIRALQQRLVDNDP